MKMIINMIKGLKIQIKSSINSDTRIDFLMNWKQHMQMNNIRKPIQIMKIHFSKKKGMWKKQLIEILPKMKI